MSSSASSSSNGLRRKLAALALGSVAALLLGEGIARLAERREPAGVSDDSAARLPGNVRPRPRAVRGDFRILVVGDSFTDGGGLFEGEPYPHRLSARLAERFGPVAFEVLTLAESGLNTVVEYRLARPWVAELSPDLILVGVCLNDPESSKRVRRREVLREAGWREPDALRALGIYRVSAAARLVVDSYHGWRSRRVMHRYYRYWYDEELPSWKAFVTALKRFRKISKSNGAHLLLVVFPIFDSPFDGRYPYRDLHARLGALASELKIPLLDLLPAYEGLDTGELAVEPFTDPHPNALAHRIATEKILDYLIAEGLLSKRSAAPTPIRAGAAESDEAAPAPR